MKDITELATAAASLYGRASVSTAPVIPEGVWGKGYRFAPSPPPPPAVSAWNKGSHSAMPALGRPSVLPTIAGPTFSALVSHYYASVILDVHLQSSPPLL